MILNRKDVKSIKKGGKNGEKIAVRPPPSKEDFDG
jgi:hypothetical protein